MTDAIATREGYTKLVVLTNGPQELWLLVRPDTDLDGHFKAWDTDDQEWLMVNGWLFCRADAGEG